MNITVTFLLMTAFVCGSVSFPAIIFAQDHYSYANIEQVQVEHIHLDLKADFDHNRFTGFVDLSLKWLDDSHRHVILDTRDLHIEHIYGKNGKGQWHSLAYQLAEKDNILGSKLAIYPVEVISQLRIYYQSSSQASGLQWLTPEQTAGKQLPFVYSQNQATHARSWIPLQDTPAIRATYSARIKTPKGLLAVMSANNQPNRTKTGDYFFQMPQPVPSYLIALAIGDLSFQSMSDITGIYAEPAFLAASVAEFNDTQHMIDVTNELYGHYPWGRYDLLILPPSFPWGGMENPRLSFITPTVIAGDKSLVNLIAHELAHSWSGNLVTNETWQDLWLNEGFTSYVENRIMEAVYGKERAVMEQHLDWQNLQRALTELPKNDTKLHIDLKHRDPDDAFTVIPYIKGQVFLLYLEREFGRETFDRFLKQYFSDFAFKSISTARFIDYLNKNLLEKYPDTVSLTAVNNWIYQPGVQGYQPQNISNAFKAVDKNVAEFLNGQINAGQINTEHWTVHQWLHFLKQLPTSLTQKQMQALDSAFNLTDHHNAEIAHVWYLLAIKTHYDVVLPSLKDYLNNIGRRKLIVPLYKALSADPKYQSWALEVYKQARPGYHILAKSTIDKILY